mmetsp:Transcript_1950/g.6992  ORF Transcript_1950/g.6992 Transcript_1950/m.6992 type:complete len:227 (+) Transcript_1950:175-855(+)
MYGNSYQSSYGGGGIASMPADLPMYDYDGGKSKGKKGKSILARIFFSLKGIMLVSILCLSVYVLYLRTVHASSVSLTRAHARKITNLEEQVNKYKAAGQNKESTFANKEKSLESTLEQHKRDLVEVRGNADKFQQDAARCVVERDIARKDLEKEKSSCEQKLKEAHEVSHALRDTLEAEHGGKTAHDRELKLAQEKVEERTVGRHPSKPYTLYPKPKLPTPLHSTS